MSSAIILEEIQRECMNCTRCGLSSTRNNVVFSDGNPNTKIMMIGEGPGEQEDLQGLPFVGPAGKFLDKMLEIIELDRTQYYICNIVKCRPPKNRDPQSSEQEACIDWLDAQIRAIQPRVIICLGRIAACQIIREDYKITKEHGKWENREGVWMTAVYHPSALLRDESKRPETFEDLKSIKKKLVDLNLI